MASPGHGAKGADDAGIAQGDDCETRVFREVDVEARHDRQGDPCAGGTLLPAMGWLLESIRQHVWMMAG